MNRVLFLILFSFSFLIAQSNDDCMDCHDDPEITKEINDSTEVTMYVNPDIFTSSVHGDMDCIECHTDLEDFEDEHEENLQIVNCADCHEDEQEEYIKSVHWLARDETDVETATCKNCHGYHDVLPSDEENSHTYKLNIEKSCGNCHEKLEVMQHLGLRGESPISKYHGSVHDKILHEDPDGNAPTCISCHDYHKILRKTNPQCIFNKRNIPQTCGNCHEQIWGEYKQSIHWQAIERGHVESPACNNCHGEHSIHSPQEEDAVTNRLNQSSQICNNCHASSIMMERYGLDHRRFESYSRSYHGLALLKGDQNAATCTSCHETHMIRGGLDSLSSVYESNLKETCGKCHDNITDSFIKIDMHPVDQETRNPIAYFFKNIYIWMIIVVIGGMFLHNVLIIVHHIREKRKLEKSMPRVQRFQPWEVYQHMLMFLSFTTLAVTGFALKFHEAGWVQLLYSLGMDEALRSLLHRTAAVVMIVISLIQLIYLVFTKKGRKDLQALMPTINDFKDLITNLKLYLGFSNKKPRLGRYDYGEKAEYLALIWGVFVMGASGFVLWFPEFFIGFLPSWLFETSEVIHYYEAWLATMAIVVWHWFFVIYHPEKYPINTTFLDGKITEEEFKHHHPLEYEQLQNEMKTAAKNSLSNNNH